MTDTTVQAPTLELTIVVPCFNERLNVAVTVERLCAALGGVEWEVLFVDDDSPDGTAQAVRELAATDRRVRCLQRIGRRGLSTAVIEGMLASTAPILAVMDGDLQHDEKLLPKMLERMKSEVLDVVVASRYLAGGDVGSWSGDRVAMSKFATKLAGFVLKSELTDPMSGFFIISRRAFEATVRRLSGHGFKILLDIFASAPGPLRYVEVPLAFRPRLYGDSKLDNLVMWEYLTLLIDKSVGRWVPARFLMFSLVGLSGVFVHFLALTWGLFFLSFTVAQALAAGVAMLSNFLINNALTYRDRRLKGTQLITGFLAFAAVCSVGSIANVGVASVAFNNQYSWWLSALAGIAMGALWNYAMSSVFTWRNH